MQGALQNLAAVIAMRTNVGRMNEILDAPLQTGSEQLTNQGCDIVFDLSLIHIYDPNALYDAYDESDDTEENSKSGYLKGVGR